MSPADVPRHRVVIIGAGFGGLPAARFLGRRAMAGRGIEVTVVDRRNHHLFQPLLYQVATALIPPGEIAPAIRHVLRKHPNVRVVCAEVTDIDTEHRVVRANTLGVLEQEIPYDSLIVAAGVNQSYFGHDEFALYAPGMKTIDDARELRRRFFGAFEMAEVTEDPDEKARWLTIAIVGAGPTGVELAGQVRELAVRSLRREFRSFDPRTVRVVLLDGGKEPLAAFGEQLSAKAARELARLGVELRMGARVVGVDAHGVDYTDSTGETRRLDASTIVWAAGVEASPLAAVLANATGAELDRAGRIAVLPDLTLPGHPEVFVVGDMMTLDRLPGVAEVAMQGGLHAANSISRRLQGQDVRPFHYRDLGSAATVGRFRSVVDFHGVRLGGFPGWVVWALVHLTFLTGFGNRITTLLKWTRSFIGRGRAEREFSVLHTGGDLSLPPEVRAIVEPNPLPVYGDRLRAGGPAPDSSDAG
ncbi:NAD(P)/FAD-dependent oxidoreductase [Nocardioides guangzhouensis]|uniref:NADH:ubiquinone reductase (non-electrogenic) n=1 Tax=Nocardioides guangzhouensis TaxID=2497878 RepID=A0A4Q4ZJY2_9ACTN|nr:NAD(P)/FAD-dependent oxidoreductase [Nocardioides guangzhouensis]RYP87754.1 NAD(P)/FAD-dependent oxidoreductase [Nocardioides guangzhouensis]